MGTPPQPAPQLGNQLNAQFSSMADTRRADRMAKMRGMNDEMFATLLKSGQRPFRSTYEPENSGAIAGGVNPNSFMFSNLFDNKVVNNEVAQALPAGPSGMDRAPGTYHQNNIIPLQTPGSNWRPGEGYSIQDPFKNSPQTRPGLSTGPRGESLITRTPTIPMGPYSPVKNFGTKDKPWIGPSTKDTHNNPSGERVIQMRWEAQEKSPAAFDEQKALLASQSADKYRKTAQTQGPFRA